MTREDYVALAGALASWRPSKAINGHAMEQWALDRDAIAGALAADNPRFDRDRFIKACEGGK